MESLAHTPSEHPIPWQQLWWRIGCPYKSGITEYAWTLPYLELSVVVTDYLRATGSPKVRGSEEARQFKCKLSSRYRPSTVNTEVSRMSLVKSYGNPHTPVCVPRVLEV